MRSSRTDEYGDHVKCPEGPAAGLYLRFHGDYYAGSYSAQRLTAEAARIRRALNHGLDVCAYFNNDAEGHAVRNALDPMRFVERPR